MKENTERKGVKRIVKDFFYDISRYIYKLKTLIFKSKKDIKNINGIKRKKMRDMGFLTLLFLFPTISILITYFGENINKFLLAFQKYDPDTKTYYFISSFENFKLAFTNITQGTASLKVVIRNSILNYVVGFVAITPLQIYVSYAIYKKVRGTPFFVVVLYLPQIVSSIVWVLMYRYMISYALPAITGSQYLGRLLTGGESFGTMIVLWVYYAWVNLGGALMIVTGTFARIETEVVEACQIDGCSLWKEFWNITFPYYFPVFAISIFTGVGGIFTGSPATYEFFGSDAPSQVWTFGYYFFTLIAGNMTASVKNYPEASAGGLICTAIVVPIVLITRYVVNRLDKMEGAI